MTTERTCRGCRVAAAAAPGSHLGTILGRILLLTLGTPLLGLIALLYLFEDAIGHHAGLGFTVAVTVLGLAFGLARGARESIDRRLIAAGFDTSLTRSAAMVRPPPMGNEPTDPQPVRVLSAAAARAQEELRRPL